jgi:hypothetical protein
MAGDLVVFDRLRRRNERRIEHRLVRHFSCHVLCFLDDAIDGGAAHPLTSEAFDSRPSMLSLLWQLGRRKLGRGHLTSSPSSKSYRRPAVSHCGPLQRDWRSVASCKLRPSRSTDQAHGHIELALRGISAERIKCGVSIPALGTADAVILVDLDDLAARLSGNLA